VPEVWLSARVPSRLSPQVATEGGVVSSRMAALAPAPSTWAALRKSTETILTPSGVESDTLFWTWGGVKASQPPGTPSTVTCIWVAPVAEMASETVCPLARLLLVSAAPPSMLTIPPEGGEASSWMCPTTVPDSLPTASRNLAETVLGPSPGARTQGTALLAT
jgi:hypothetical protein